MVERPFIDVESREDASRNGTTKRRVSEGRSVGRSWRGRAVSLKTWAVVVRQTKQKGTKTPTPK
jgi:hypothetical protein